MSWPSATLGNVAIIDRLSVQPNINSGRYVGLEDIGSDGLIKVDRDINAEDLASSKFSFTSAHILFGKLRPYLRKVARPSFSGICSTDILPIHPKEGIDKDYLFHYLRTPFVIDLATARSSGANLPRISPSILSEFPVPVPPLAEQKRIAAILDKADVIRRKREKAIKLADEFLRSLFLDMFGDPVRNPKGWASGTIDLVVKNPREDIRCGPFGTQLKVHELVPSGVPLIGIENVHNMSFKADFKRFITPEKAQDLFRFDTLPGDVLVTRMGTIGRACVVPDSVSFARISYHLFRVRPDVDLCLPEFLAATICRSGVFRRQLEQTAHGAIMDGLSTVDLRSVKFLLPPITQQSRYVRAVRTVDKLLDSLHDPMLKALQGSLINRAFKGGV